MITITTTSPGRNTRQANRNGREDGNSPRRRCRTAAARGRRGAGPGTGDGRHLRWCRLRLLHRLMHRLVGSGLRLRLGHGDGRNAGGILERVVIRELGRRQPERQ